MTRDPNSYPGRNRPKPRPGERVAVLAPLVLAVTATLFGAGEALLAPLWAAALAWTVLASFALALYSGLRRGDWSAFRRYRHEEDREEEMDLDTRTGGVRVPAPARRGPGGRQP